MTTRNRKFLRQYTLDQGLRPKYNNVMVRQEDIQFKPPMKCQVVEMPFKHHLNSSQLKEKLNSEELQPPSEATSNLESTPVMSSPKTIAPHQDLMHQEEPTASVPAVSQLIPQRRQSSRETKKTKHYDAASGSWS